MKLFTAFVLPRVQHLGGLRKTPIKWSRSDNWNDNVDVKGRADSARRPNYCVSAERAAANCHHEQDIQGVPDAQHHTIADTTGVAFPILEVGGKVQYIR